FVIGLYPEKLRQNPGIQAQELVSKSMGTVTLVVCPKAGLLGIFTVFFAAPTCYNTRLPKMCRISARSRGKTRTFPAGSMSLPSLRDSEKASKRWGSLSYRSSWLRLVEPVDIPGGRGVVFLEVTVA